MLASSSEDELTKAAVVLCFSVSGADSVSFLGIMEGDFEAYDHVEAITEPLRSPLYPRSQLTDQPAGRIVAFKENTCVVGLPMQHGPTILTDYVLEIDATVVTRLLYARAAPDRSYSCPSCISGAALLHN